MLSALARCVSDRRAPPQLAFIGMLALALTACPRGDFDISAASTPLNAQPGSSITATINVSRIAPFGGAVALELSNPPAGVSAPSLTVPASDSSGQLILSVAPNVAPGAFNLTVTGSADGKAHTATLRLNVIAPSTTVGFALGVQNSPTVTQGERAILSVKLERATGFNDPVVVDLQTPPSGITTSPVTLAPGASSGSLTVSVAASVAPGPVALIVRGAGGGATKTVSASLTVSAAQDFIIAPTGSPDMVSPQDRTLTMPIAVTRLSGFNDALQFGLEGEDVGSGPDKFEATFTPNPVLNTNTATSLQLKIGANVAPKRYDLTVRATSGGRSRVAALRLEVQGPLVMIGVPTAPVVRLREVGAQFLTIPLERTNGFADTVEVTAQAPTGLLVNVGSNPTTGNSVTVSVYATAQAQLGPNTVALSTTNLGTRNARSSFTVDVLQPDFTISASSPANPDSSTVVIPGGAGLFTSSRNLNVSVANPQNGFDAGVGFAVTDLPPGASFTGINIQPGRVGSLPITLNRGVTPGKYPITITGSHPGLSVPKTVPFTLEVQLGERLYEEFAGSASIWDRGWGTNKNGNVQLWVSSQGAAYAYANRARASTAANLVTPQIPSPAAGHPCDGELVLTFTSFFGSTGSGRLRVLLQNDVPGIGPPREIAKPAYVAGGVVRNDGPITLDKTFLSSGNDARLTFEFTPSSNAATEFWGVDNVLVACR